MNPSALFLKTIILAVCLLSFKANAQPPAKISYQAVVRNDSGKLVANHNIGYRISILKGSKNGEIAYGQAGDCMSNGNGLISLELGAGSHISDIDWAADIYFLKTEIDPEGGCNYTITGTSRILSVPYAQYAAKAGNGYDSKNNSFYMGKGSGSSSDGEMNVFIGDSAGYKNTAGTRNTAVGYLSSYNNTTGDCSTAIGNRALFSNTTGKGNTATGYRALYSNNTGYFNTASGFYALHNNTTGYSNVAIGTAALRNNTTQSNLVAIGDSALFWNGYGATGNSQGSYNTAVGSKALLSNTTGHRNTAIGREALRSNTTGSNNAAFGTSALGMNNIGDDNTAIGVYAGNRVKGSGNVFVGTYAGYYEEGYEKLYIDSRYRGNEADGRTKSLIYGEFAAEPAFQQLTVNGHLNALSLNGISFFIKGGNNGTVSGDTFCKGSQWGRVGVCIAVKRIDTGEYISTTAIANTPVTCMCAAF